MHNKTPADTVSPLAKMAQPGTGRACPAHDHADRIGISIPPSVRVLRIKDVINRTGLSRSTLYGLMKSDPTFPKKVSLSPRTTGVIEHQLDMWITLRAGSRASA